MCATKPEDVVEILTDFLEKKTIVFVAVEEAGVLGYNIVQFLIELGIDGVIGYLTFQYTPLIDELTPIALIIEFSEEISKELNFSSIADLLTDVGGLCIWFRRGNRDSTSANDG